MPYVLFRRNDIPDGFLETLDLRPNTSQRNFPYETYGQTGYRRNPENDAPTLTAFTFDNDTTGLSAWLLANVSSGSGGFSSGSITTVPVANLNDGENVVISDGATSITFVFNVTGSYGVASPNVEVDVSALVTANDVRDALITAINAQTPYDIVAANGGAATVTLTNLNENIPAASRNVAITETVAFAGTAATGFFTVVNAPLTAPGGVQSTGTFVVNVAPLTGVGVDWLDVAGIPLQSVAGPRTPGAGDFDGTLAAPPLLSAEITAAINDPLNPWVLAGTVFATDLIGAVLITAVVPGVAGDLFTIGATLVVPGEIAPSGPTLAGGVDPDQIIINGIPLVSAAGPRTPGLNDFDGTLIPQAAMVADMAAAINDPANAFIGTVIANPNVAQLDIIAATVGAAGNAITLAVALANPADITTSGPTLAGGADGFGVTGMVGATDSTALTPAQAIQDATDILTQLAAGGALDPVTLNGVLTTGSIGETQLLDLLDILDGRTYTVPAGTVVQAAGAFTPAGSANFFDGDIRRIYDSGPLRISLGEGRLSLATSANFTYGGVAGAAVQVYHNDGTVYTLP